MTSHDSRIRTAQKAFTLIELLTVIAIIGILAAIIIPTVGSVRKTARSAQAVSNIKQIGMATLLYSQDNRGAVLGPSDNADGQGGFGYFETTMRQWTTYLSRAPQSQIDRVNAILAQVRDPFVPNEPEFLRSQYATTWAVNRIFNPLKGYQAQGLVTSQTTAKYRNMSEFTEPSRTIYAMSGAYEISATNIVDASLLNPPTKFQGIYYYHRDGRATPVLFLDGSARIMDFPVDPKLTKLRQFQ